MDTSIGPKGVAPGAPHWAAHYFARALPDEPGTTRTTWSGPAALHDPESGLAVFLVQRCYSDGADSRTEPVRVALSLPERTVNLSAADAAALAAAFARLATDAHELNRKLGIDELYGDEELEALALAESVLALRPFIKRDPS